MRLNIMSTTHGKKADSTGENIIGSVGTRTYLERERGLGVQNPPALFYRNYCPVSGLTLHCLLQVLVIPDKLNPVCGRTRGSQEQGKGNGPNGSSHHASVEAQACPNGPTGRDGTVYSRQAEHHRPDTNGQELGTNLGKDFPFTLLYCRLHSGN